METLIGLAFIGVVWFICKTLPAKRFDNYMPPTGQRIDHNAQALDRVQNHLTNEQVMYNTRNGKYNVKR